MELNNQAINIMQQGMLESGKEKEKYYNEALNLFNEAIEIDSSIINSYDNKINILVDMKRYTEAIEVLELKLIREPDLAEGYFFLGLLSEAINDTISAYELYNKSIDIYEDRISQGKMIEANEINLALSYLFIDDEEKANELFQKYLLDEKYGTTVEIVYGKKKEELLKEMLHIN
jgi:tetratricopeptide (TPR) repeat protein